MAKAATAKAPSKTEVINNIAQATELTKKQVAAVFDALNDQIKASLKKGSFQVPGLCKIVVKQIPAKKAGERMDPFTKQMRMFPAKPARKTVRIRPLKALKDMV